MTWGGKLFGNISFAAAAVGGKWIFQDALVLGTGTTVSVLGGHVDANNQAITCANFASTGTTARTLTLGTSTVTLTGTGSSTWSIAATLNLSAESATIVFSSASASSRSFTGSKTYGTVTYVNAGTGSLLITGGNTIGTLNVSGAARTLQFASGFTNTITNWNVNGTAGALITIQSSLAGSNTTVLDKAGGGVAVSEYVALKDITATPAATWYASTGSVDNGNNDGWTFGAPPGGVAHDLSGTTSGASALEAATLDVTGAPVVHALAGASTGTSSLGAAALRVVAPLAGTSTGTSSLQAASLGVVGALAGTADGTSAVAGSVTEVNSLLGFTHGTSTVAAAALTVVHALTGLTAGTSTAAADLSVQRIMLQLAALTSGVSGMSGALTLLIALEGTTGGAEGGGVEGVVLDGRRLVHRTRVLEHAL